MGSKVKLAWLVAFVLLLAMDVYALITNPDKLSNWVWVLIISLVTIASYADWNQSRKEVE